MKKTGFADHYHSHPRDPGLINGTNVNTHCTKSSRPVGKRNVADGGFLQSVSISFPSLAVTSVSYSTFLLAGADWTGSWC